MMTKSFVFIATAVVALLHLQTITSTTTTTSTIRVVGVKVKRPEKLSIHIKESARRSAFEELWEEVQTDLASGDKNSGLGLFPHVGTAFSEGEKLRRYEDHFVSAYNKVTFLPRHPVVTAINFFALLSEEEKSRYLGANVTERAMRSVLEQLAPEDLEQYDLEQEEGYRESEKSLFHSQLGGYSELKENVNFTQVNVEARSTGAYHTAGLFSALSVLEYVYRLKTIFKTSERKQFSRQYLVDCLYHHGPLQDGWLPHRVYRSLRKTGYLPLEEDLPYTGARERCPTTRHRKIHSELSNALELSVEVVGWQVNFETESGMLDVFKRSGPISVCIHVNDHIFYYESGFSNECVAGIQCNHFVTLLAYNQDYITVENSWGRNWGIQGKMDMLRGNCAQLPEKGRYFVTSVTLTIIQDTAEEEEGEGKEETDQFTLVMDMSGLVNDKDYYLISEIQVGDVLLLKAKAIIMDIEKVKSLHAYFRLFEIDSKENIPYHIMIDLEHYLVSQTYYFGHEHAQFPKLTEKLHWEDLQRLTTEIRIVFTRNHIQTSINGKMLEPFYHQVDIKTIESFEIHGPVGWFKSLQHLRPKGNY